MTSQHNRLSGPDGAVDVSYLRSCSTIPGAQAAWDHIVWWLGRRVVAATTQARLLVWSDVLISGVLELSRATRRLMAMTAPWSVRSERRRSWPQSAAVHCARQVIRYETMPCHAESEDRIHDLRIMRPTRYQLRYFRLEQFANILANKCARSMTAACSCS